MFCTNCGAENPDNTNFCTNCGAKLGVPDQNTAGNQPDMNAGFTPGSDMNAGFTGANDQPMGFDPTNAANTQGNFGYQAGPDNYGYQQGMGNPYYGGPGAGIAGRSIPLAIILSIVTCGIYAIYWFIVLTDETNQLSNRPNETSGVVSLLLTIVTCSIYGWIWAYRLGEKVDAIKNTPGGGSGILFLILQFFGLGIVNYAIAQDAINRAVGYQG
jgi:hypothetical protein